VAHGDSQYSFKPGGRAVGRKLCSVKVEKNYDELLPWTKIFSTSSDQTSLPSLRSLWCLRWGVRDFAAEDASAIHLSVARDLGRAEGDGVEEEEVWCERTRRDERSSPM
jgi:hypothetical protein